MADHRVVGAEPEADAWFGDEVLRRAEIGLQLSSERGEVTLGSATGWSVWSSAPRNVLVAPTVDFCGRRSLSAHSGPLALKEPSQ